jgi:hypothetical protein
MSLDILKERFSGKPITSQYEDKIQDKEKIIEKLELEAQSLSNQVLNLEKEKDFLVQELNTAKKFEDGAFSIKEKDYINELQIKENTIKEINSQFNPLHTKINKLQDRISYKDEVIEKAKKLNKQLNEKLNKLNYKLNHETKNSKKVVNEVTEERKRVYQEYVNNLDTYEKALVSKNDKIDNYKTKLKESLNKLKESKDLISVLKKDIKVNENVREELRNKKEEIKNLNGEIRSLSREVKHLSSLSYENSILERKLEKAEGFQNIVSDKKDNFMEYIKETNNLSTYKLIGTLTEISREKQGDKKLTWDEWLEIPESNYLFQLDETMAKNIFDEGRKLKLLDINNNKLAIFNESQEIADESRISNKANLNEYRHFSTGRGDAPDLRLEPLKIGNLQGYYSTYHAGFSSTQSDGDEVATWNDLSGNDNNLIQSASTNLPEYNASENSLLFKRRDEAATNDNYIFTNDINASEFTTFFVVDMTADSGVHFHHLLIDLEDNDQITVQFAADNRAFLQVKANDGTNNVSTQIIKDAGVVNEGTKLLLTCRKKPFNSGDGYGQVEWYLNTTSMGTNNNYDENIVHKIQRLGDDNTFTGFKGHMYELAIYDRALTDNEVLKLQNYFIDTTNISV